MSSVTFSDQILSIRPLTGSSSSAVKSTKIGTLGLCNLQDQEGYIGSKKEWIPSWGEEPIAK